ncbi:MAG: NAD(P)-binding domain-containing protein, partial [Pseudomonadota bacterium]
MAEGLRVGFVGLGVMGAPMCGHLHAKRGPKGLQSVTALDLNAEARASASQEGIAVTDDLGSLVAGSDQIHVC